MSVTMSTDSVIKGPSPTGNSQENPHHITGHGVRWGAPSLPSTLPSPASHPELHHLIRELIQVIDHFMEPLSVITANGKGASDL
jgi:hypothetical protein